ncbi:hypothetical protein BYT27DRAFT_7209501 [Phlegmacium glaucopus]|nr:hypothetical protein BYT27DRAFT_7209501 [Phlegmacium glaucopus]
MQSILKHISMSFSSDSLALHRKRTVTECAANNGDPLVVRKKAHKAMKSNIAPTVAKPPNNGSNCDDDDDSDDVVPVAPPKKSQPAARSTSVRMEEVDDEDIYLRTSVAPSNLSRVLELSNGTDDSNDEEDCPPSLVTADDDDNDENEVPEEPEESAEASDGQV